MKNITRIVVDAGSPQILTFKKDDLFRSKIFYDYFNNKRVSKRCPKETKLVRGKVNQERINSAISFGQGAFFLLTNLDEEGTGDNYLGFIDSFRRFSLSLLPGGAEPDNSFFVNIFDSSRRYEKKSREYLLLANHRLMNYTSLYPLKFGKTDLGISDIHSRSLIWSDKRKSYLIVKSSGEIVDSNGSCVNALCIAEEKFREAFLRHDFLFETSKEERGNILINKLVNSPTYEEIFKE